MWEHLNSAFTRNCNPILVVAFHKSQLQLNIWIKYGKNQVFPYRNVASSNWISYFSAYCRSIVKSYIFSIWEVDCIWHTPGNDVEHLVFIISYSISSICNERRMPRADERECSKLQHFNGIRTEKQMLPGSSNTRSNKHLTLMHATTNLPYPS